MTSDLRTKARVKDGLAQARAIQELERLPGGRGSKIYRQLVAGKIKPVKPVEQSSK